MAEGSRNSTSCKREVAMLRRMVTGVVLTITSSLAISVALNSVSASAGGSTPVSLADVVSSSVSGTLTSPANGCPNPADFDASYAGSPQVGTVALHIAGCIINGSNSSSGL